MIKVPPAQIPGVYHRKIGDIVVTALSDGYLDGTVEVMQNVTPADATQMLTDKMRPGRRTSVNCYLVYSAGRLALIEALRSGAIDCKRVQAGKKHLNSHKTGKRKRQLRSPLIMGGKIAAKYILVMGGHA